MAEYLHDHPIVPRTDEEKQAVINRLKRIEGQIRGLQKMVDEDRYCVDILVQIRAVQAALKKSGILGGRTPYETLRARCSTNR